MLLADPWNTNRGFLVSVHSTRIDSIRLYTAALPA